MTRLRHFIADAPTLAAIVVMLLSMFLFTSNDALGKWLAGNYSVGQLLFVRSLVAMVVLLPFIRQVGLRSLFAIDRPWIMLLRVVFTIVDTAAFYFAVSQLPLADVMTFWLAAPIYVAAFSPLLLGEHVGWRRWTAILIGFAGVVIALEPSSAMFSPAAIASLFGSMCFGFAMLTARTMRSTSGVSMITWQMFGSLVAGAVTLPFAWETPPAGEWPAFIMLGLTAMLAHVLVNFAFKLADAATVAPLQYTQLFWAIVFGWLVFGDFPSMSKFIGAGLIIASGLFIALRERHLARERALKTGGPTG